MAGPVLFAVRQKTYGHLGRDICKRTDSREAKAQVR